jgi:transposase
MREAFRWPALPVQPGDVTMQRSPRKNYSKQFKQQAVALVEGGKTPIAVSRQLGVARQSIDNWRQAAANGDLKATREEAVARNQLVSLQADNLCLRKENELLRSALAARQTSRTRRA